MSIQRCLCCKTLDSYLMCRSWMSRISSASTSTFKWQRKEETASCSNRKNWISDIPQEGMCSIKSSWSVHRWQKSPTLGCWCLAEDVCRRKTGTINKIDTISIKCRKTYIFAISLYLVCLKFSISNTFSCSHMWRKARS